MSKALQRFMVVTFLALTVVSTVACDQNVVPDHPTDQINRIQAYKTDSDSKGVHTYDVHKYSVWPYTGTSPFDHPGSRFKTNVNGHPIAADTAKLAESVPGVRTAATFVQGNDVVVALEINNSTNNRQMVERQVRETIQAGLPGYNVHVTADGELSARVRALRSQLGNRQPFHTLTDDVGALLRDIDR